MTNAAINIRDDLLYQEDSGKVLEACKEVYKEFGGSFKESIVDRALTVALEKHGLSVESQKRIDIYSSGIKVGVYVPDNVVSGKIMLEIKCNPFISTEDEKQFWRYLKATDYKLGFLINFSPDKLKVKRRIYDLARNKPASV